MAKRQAAAAMLVVSLILDDECENKHGKTSDWIKRREVKGAFTNIIKGLRMEDSIGFKDDDENGLSNFFLSFKLYRT